MYHGCIPIDEDGNFEDCTVNGVTTSGKAYMDYLDEQVRKAYFAPDQSQETGRSGDLMWYLWLSSKSPLFGKDQMTTSNGVSWQTRKHIRNTPFRIIN